MNGALRNWLKRQMGRDVSAIPGHEARLAAWHALPSADPATPLDRQEWLVVDVETTGLDVRSDRLIAIGAIRMQGNRIEYGASFDVVLRQEEASSRDNILIHRIAGDEQRQGLDPAEALVAFLEFAGKRPIVGYHAGFDRAMIAKEMRAHLALRFDAPFLDLALAAPTLLADRDGPLPDNLDGWLARHDIVIAQRHRAVFDALGTAQFFQVVLGAAHEKGIARARQLFALADDEAWLQRTRRH